MPDDSKSQKQHEGEETQVPVTQPVICATCPLLQKDEDGQWKHPHFDKTADPGDGREPGYWKSRYDGRALQGIRLEASYLSLLVVAASMSFWVLYVMVHRNDPPPPSVLVEVRLYLYAFLGGLLGGWTFTTMWLIGAISRFRWDEDRRLWRFLNPVVSGVLGVMFFAIVRSGQFKVFDAMSFGTGSAAASLGFLVGFFSDRAIGKLGDVADAIFGSKHGSNKPGVPDRREQGLEDGDATK